MLNNHGAVANISASISPASYAAGAANGSWVDLTNSQGEITIPITLGAVTGSVILKVQDATDTSGTGAADLSGVTTASLNTANSTAKLTFPSSSARQAVRVVATVTTGPIFISAPVVQIKKIT